ncbi:MAG: methionine adenosyltransferase domain-containing protein [Calditrichota bacterium]
MKQTESGILDMRRPLFGGYNSAAEFVTLGHPDKTCDQIAGRILDQALIINPDSHVAIEMVACNGKIALGGEVSPALLDKIDFKQVPVDVFSGMGYNRPPFKIQREDVTVFINRQSQEINDGVVHKPAHLGDNQDKEHINAGDQGVMDGYAMFAPEREHMPAAVWFAQRLAMRLWHVTQKRIIPDLFADGKTQVIITNGKISSVTIAIHHGASWHTEPGQPLKLRGPIYDQVIRPIIGEVTNYFVNAAGNFENGSIWADSAEVGRKIVIDQMGPDIPVGGGTLNGKDPSKVDLTGAVMARHIAKNIVANRLADEALVQFAFTIGQPEPDALNIYVPGWKSAQSPEEWCRKHFPLKVEEMIEYLGLAQLKGWSYEQAAQFGFYGHAQFPWERTREIK